MWHAKPTELPTPALISKSQILFTEVDRQQKGSYRQIKITGDI